MSCVGQKAAALCALLIPLACTTPEPESVGGTPTDAEGQATPGDLVTTWVEMWNSYDLDQVRNLFLTDERVSYFSSEFQGVIQGFAAVLEHHEGFGFVSGGDDRATRLWVEDVTEDRFGSSAVLTAVWYFASGGAELDTPPQRGPVTFVCVLEDGAWRFAHMNFGNYLDPVEPVGG